MKTALVTGGSRGLGRAIAIQLVKDHGFHVLINYTANEKAALDTLEEVKKSGGTGEIMKFDVQDKVQVDGALEGWNERNSEGFIDLVINNAGITKDGLLMMMEESHWDSVVNIALKGFYNVTKPLVTKMLRKRTGKVINIASLSGLKGVPGQTNYSAAKGGLIAATKALAGEVAKRGITVNAVAPGFIKSDMTEDLNEDELKKLVPLNRFGEADEVAHLVSFLASDKANYITGEVININGGIYS